MAKLPSKSQINSAVSSFSKKERIIFSALVFVLFSSTIFILASINNYFMVSVPKYGGSITEGIIGVPRFVNPILAFSGADDDLVSLVYSGLMRKDKDGNLIPDLAEKYEVSKDGLRYTFTLKDDLYFHDGSAVTVDDIIFTVGKIKDPAVKSSRKASWDGVTVEKTDEKTVVFSLKQPYASFLENATLGIMPAHIWKEAPFELNSANTAPVGSGPYMVENANKESSGVISEYTLVAFGKYALGRPYVKNIYVRFYSNESDLIAALENKEVDHASSLSPSNAKNLKEEGYAVDSAVLPRVFGLFFNQNVNQLFLDKGVVKAIDQGIDKERLVREVLAGYGVPIDNAIPPSLVQYQTPEAKDKITREDVIKNVGDMLAADGWKKNTAGFLEKTVTVKKKTTVTPLEFSISTGNAPELAQAAELIKEDLEAVGMKVDIKTFEIGSLNQEVIRPRKYDALLFGEIINNESDLFAFWHSSQRRDPGLNVAMYTSAKADKILEDASITVDKASRVKKYLQFEDEIKKDMPAAFLYSPDFIYIVSNTLEGLSLGAITTPSDRFSNVYLWYTEKDNVWKIFTPTH